MKETLENRGVLGQIKARLRAEVFNALDDQAEARPQLCNENLLINELIREYLEFNKYKYAASVLQAGEYVSCTRECSQIFYYNIKYLFHIKKISENLDTSHVFWVGIIHHCFICCVLTLKH